MWQQSGPERESRTNKCMSGLVWLGEREHESPPRAAAGTPASGATREQKLAARNAKRFTHVFSREWAIPETLALYSRGEGSTRAPRAATVEGSALTASAPVERGGRETGSEPDARPKGAKPLTDLSLSVGDMVCVSAQGGVPSARRRRGGGGDGSGLDHVRLLTGNISAVHEDRVEVWSDKRMKVPRRGGKKRIGGGGGGCGRSTGGGAGEALDIEDLLGGGGEMDGEEVVEERVLFRIDKDEWAAGIK